MNIIEESFRELFYEFRDCNFEYDTKLRYSKAFKGFNANIKYYGSKNQIVLSLSKNWRDVSKNIRKGLIQELLLKMFKSKYKYKRTLEMDLYQIYLKNAHIGAEKNNIDPILQESFDRVNDEYFYGMIDQTNLVWGSYSIRTLGRYEYGSDTITISSIFKNAPIQLTDRVMHHEMLHKKHKYNSKNGRCHHHTKAFRNDEKKYRDFESVEKEIRKYIRNFELKNLGHKSNSQNNVPSTKNFLNKFFGV